MLFEKQIEALYRSQLFIRNDNPQGIFYFSPADFPGLQAHPYAFPGKNSQTLRGYFYHYDCPRPDRLLVFDHGMGNGHRAYFREIEVLAKAGYLVFSYDHTGCMESGGDSTNGFAQSLSDLDACLTALKAEEALLGRTIAVLGHSWGAFSTLNIPALHPEVTHIVALAGFISVEQIVNQNFSGVLSGYRPLILSLEQRTNPNYVNFNAVDTLSNTATKALLVYSSNDPMVSKALHYDVLYKALAGKPHIRFLLTHGKGHSPNYTTDAAAYKDQFFAQFQEAMKKKQLQTEAQQQKFMARFDWCRMTAQDDRIWRIILDYLES